MLLRGEGISLESLPVIGDNGAMRNLSRVPKGKTAQDLVNMIQITARIMDGRRVIGYMVKNYGGQEAKWSRNKVLEFAQNNKIVNAKAQTHNGKIILKGHNCDLTALPEITAEQAGLKKPNSGTDSIEALEKLHKSFVNKIDNKLKELGICNDMVVEGKQYRWEFKVFDNTFIQYTINDSFKKSGIKIPDLHGSEVKFEFIVKCSCS